jgi:hypothetical protein
VGYEHLDVPDQVSALAAANGIFEIRPYFFPLECACTDEGTKTFAYETG